MAEDYMIEVKELTKNMVIFMQWTIFSFDVKKGEIFGFLGANGAGKTTAMKMLCGLNKPTSGKARVAGFDVLSEAEKIKKILVT
jgi:ABC-2 type transport system ATP-binding protein